jgi:hypothetical protein
MSKSIIDARQALRDIQAGMDDSALMRKYNLSTKGLRSLFSKLTAAGYIREINPREFIKDIRSGLDYSGLMQKYRLSSVGLERLLKDIQDFGLMPGSQSPASKLGKLTISVREIVGDIRAGVDEFGLLAKYGLSATGLQRVLHKLLDTGVILPADLLRISSSATETVRILEPRELVRCYPVLSLRVCEARNTTLGGLVRDITQMGVGTIGLYVNAGEEKHLLAGVDELLQIKPFLFKGVCKWSRIEQPRSRCLAGFEIKQIFEDSLSNLQEFIRFSTVQFDREPSPAR